MDRVGQPGQVRDFGDDLAWSAGHAIGEDIGAILKNIIPLVTSLRRASMDQDRSGTDWWVDRASGLDALSVDVKIRDIDPIEEFRVDDLALELWSVRPHGSNPGKIGWTFDPSKRTDFILWSWTRTGRYFLVSFPLLCQASILHRGEWETRFTHKIQKSGGAGRVGWESECLFVLRRTVIDAIEELSAGILHRP